MSISYTDAAGAGATPVDNASQNTNSGNGNPTPTSVSKSKVEEIDVSLKGLSIVAAPDVSQQPQPQVSHVRQPQSILQPKLPEASPASVLSSNSQDRDKESVDKKRSPSSTTSAALAGKVSPSSPSSVSQIVKPLAIKPSASAPASASRKPSYAATLSKSGSAPADSTRHVRGSTPPSSGSRHSRDGGSIKSRRSGGSLTVPSSTSSSSSRVKQSRRRSPTTASAVETGDSQPSKPKNNGSQPCSRERQIAQRQKQIDFGKNTIGYENYIASVPVESRQNIPQHPRTPDPAAPLSLRSFSGLVRAWRRALHQWDNPPAAIASTRASPERLDLGAAMPLIAPAPGVAGGSSSSSLPSSVSSSASSSSSTTLNHANGTNNNVSRQQRPMSSTTSTTSSSATLRVSTVPSTTTSSAESSTSTTPNNSGKLSKALKNGASNPLQANRAPAGPGFGGEGGFASRTRPSNNYFLPVAGANGMPHMHVPSYSSAPNGAGAMFAPSHHAHLHHPHGTPHPHGPLPPLSHHHHPHHPHALNPYAAAAAAMHANPQHIDANTMALFLLQQQQQAHSAHDMAVGARGMGPQASAYGIPPYRHHHHYGNDLNMMRWS